MSAGSRFKGNNKGKVSFGGTNTAETVDGQNVNVGSEFDGDNEETAVVNFNENNTVKHVNQEKNDQRVSQMQPLAGASEPQAAKVATFQKIPRIGSTVVVTATELGFQIKGHVTIFNQEFKNTKNFRDGSSKDVKDLEEAFKRFGIEPVVKPDLKYKEIVKEINSLSTADFSTYKLFVCIFMSHGHGNGIVCAKDKEFKLKQTIIYPIMENSTLNGIPKIFITVACRGSGNYEEFDNEEFDGHILSTSDGIDYSNCIISYSTYEGHVSKRTCNGTYFIQYLCDNINKANGDTIIHSIFADVNGKLADMYKQVPVFETTMGNICFRDLASTPNYGTISVEAADGQSAIVGSEFNGEQKGVLICREVSTVTNVIGPKVPKVEPFQSIPRVGDTVIVTPDGVKNDPVQYRNHGSVTVAGTVHGKIVNVMSYDGSVPDYVASDSQLNRETHNNVGNVTRVGKVRGDVEFDTNINITTPK